MMSGSSPTLPARAWVPGSGRCWSPNTAALPVLFYTSIHTASYVTLTTRKLLSLDSLKKNSTFPNYWDVFEAKDSAL